MSSARPTAPNRQLQRTYGELRPLVEDTRFFINRLTGITALNSSSLITRYGAADIGDGYARCHTYQNIRRATVYRPVVPDSPIQIHRILLAEEFEPDRQKSDATLTGQTIEVYAKRPESSFTPEASKLIDEYAEPPLRHAPHSSSAFLTTHEELTYDNPLDYKDPEALTRDYAATHMTRIASGLIVSRCVDLALTGIGELPVTMQPDATDSLIGRWSRVEPDLVTNVQEEFYRIFAEG
ncbi:MAG: hypothetical protein AAB834_04860 [Patescibacteria group bacterium]